MILPFNTIFKLQIRKTYYTQEKQTQINMKTYFVKLINLRMKKMLQKNVSQDFCSICFPPPTPTK